VPADDVGFIDTIVADLRAGLPIDGRRVYASGFSNGAGFAARLSVDRADQLAAVAYSGGGLPAAQVASRPVPTFVSAGTLDDRIIEHVDPALTELPLDPVGILTQPGLSAFFGFYHSTLGLDPRLYTAIAAPHASTLRWSANGAVFKFAMLEGVTHQYPNGTNNPNGFAAAPEFWEFLRSYRAP
jgi:polyhydroxybutyrate depolymerase